MSFILFSDIKIRDWLFDRESKKKNNNPKTINFPFNQQNLNRINLWRSNDYKNAI